MEENVSNAPKAEKASISLYPSHIAKIQSFSKKNNFRSDSAALQHILDAYFKQKTKLLKDFMLFVGYPFIIIILMLFVYLATHNVNEILLEREIYFNELYILDQMFFVMGIAALGVSLPLIYIFKRKFSESRKNGN